MNKCNVVLAGMLAAFSGVAAAQAKAPVAQFWMDVATHNMSVPGMGDGDAGFGGLFGSTFGTTKGMGGAPGQWLDTALYTRNKPSGTEGTHAIPPAMNMGSTLPLVPVTRSASKPGEEEEVGEKPKGRLLFYWGCGDKIRAGQPKVVDFSRLGAAEWARFMQGRYAPDRGAKAVPGRSVWPNERDRQRVPKNASLVGDHEVSGEGVPPGLRFMLRDGQDFMPRVRLSAPGEVSNPVNVSWDAVRSAQGYFLTAMGARGEEEMIIWSSSEQPDPGWGLMNYVAPAQVNKLIGEKVVLPPTRQNCTIPAGVFANTEGAMVNMIAYGPEYNFAYPPRPANAKNWEPEWAARVRVKSTGMTMIGMDDKDGGGHGGRQQEESQDSGIGVGNVIRGILGF